MGADRVAPDSVAERNPVAACRWMAGRAAPLSKSDKSDTIKKGKSENSDSLHARTRDLNARPVAITKNLLTFVCPQGCIYNAKAALNLSRFGAVFPSIFHYHAKITPILRNEKRQRIENQSIAVFL